MRRRATEAAPEDALLPREAAEALSCTTSEIVRGLRVLVQVQAANSRDAGATATGAGSNESLPALGTAPTDSWDASGVPVEHASPCLLITQAGSQDVDLGALSSLVQDLLAFLGEWDEFLNPSYGGEVDTDGAPPVPTLDWYVDADGVVAEAGLAPLAARRGLLRTGVLGVALESFAYLPPPTRSFPDMDMTSSAAAACHARLEALMHLLRSFMKLIVAVILPPPASLIRQIANVLQQTPQQRPSRASETDFADASIPNSSPLVVAALAFREALDEIHAAVLQLGALLVRHRTHQRSAGEDAPFSALDWIADMFVSAVRALPATWSDVELCLLLFSAFIREPACLDRPTPWSKKHIPAAFDREARLATHREAQSIAQELLLQLMCPEELDLFRLIHAVVMQAPHLESATATTTCSMTDSVMNAAVEIYHAAWVRFFPVEHFAEHVFTECGTPVDHARKAFLDGWQPLQARLDRERDQRANRHGLMRTARWAAQRPSTWIVVPKCSPSDGIRGTGTSRKRVALDPDDLWSELQQDAPCFQQALRRCGRAGDWHGERARRSDLGTLQPENASVFYNPSKRVGTLPPSWTRLAALSATETEPGLGPLVRHAGTTGDSSPQAAAAWALWVRQAGLALYELGQYGLRQLVRAVRNPSAAPWSELPAFLELASAIMQFHFWEQAAQVAEPTWCARSRAVLLLLEAHGYGRVPDDLSAWPSLCLSEMVHDSDIADKLHHELTQRFYRDQRPTLPEASTGERVTQHAPPNSKWKQALMDALLGDVPLQAALQILCACIRVHSGGCRRRSAAAEEHQDAWEQDSFGTESEPPDLAVAYLVPPETIMRFVFLQWRALLAEVDGLRRLAAFCCANRTAACTVARAIPRLDGRRCSRLYLDRAFSLLWLFAFVGKCVLPRPHHDLDACTPAENHEFARCIYGLPRLGHCLLLPLYEVLVQTWPAPLYKTSGWLRALDLLAQCWTAAAAFGDAEPATAAVSSHMFSWHALLVCSAAFERRADHQRSQSGLRLSACRDAASALDDMVQLSRTLASAWRKRLAERPLLLIEALIGRCKGRTAAVSEARESLAMHRAPPRSSASPDRHLTVPSTAGQSLGQPPTGTVADERTQPTSWFASSPSSSSSSSSPLMLTTPPAPKDARGVDALAAPTARAPANGLAARMRDRRGMRPSRPVLLSDATESTVDACTTQIRSSEFAPCADSA